MYRVPRAIGVRYLEATRPVPSCLFVVVEVEDEVEVDLVAVAGEVDGEVGAVEEEEDITKTWDLLKL